jgi:hypothetical protein
MHAERTRTIVIGGARSWRRALAAGLTIAALAGCSDGAGEPVDIGSGQAETTSDDSRTAVLDAAVQAGDLDDVEERIGPPPQVVELDQDAGRARVEDCTIDPDGTAVGTTVLLAEADGSWEATRTETTDGCLPAGLDQTIDDWWAGRAQWLAEPSPDHPLLDQVLTGDALTQTRQLLGDWRDQGLVGDVFEETAAGGRHLRGITGAGIVMRTCGPTGLAYIEDTVDGSRPVEVEFDRHELADLTLTWSEDGGWQVADTTLVGIEPGVEWDACAAPDDAGGTGGG